MKKIKLVLLLSLFVISVSAQQTTSAPGLPKTEYMKKSKKQKTTAWILLGGGTTVGFIGLTQLNLAGSDNGEVNNTPGTVMFIVGGVAALTSISFFSASKKNKRKAISMSFKNQMIPQLQTNGIVYRAIPSFNAIIGL